MKKTLKEVVRGGRSEERRVHTRNSLLSLCKYGINVPPFHLILHLKLFGEGGGGRKDEGGGREGGREGGRGRNGRWNKAETERHDIEPL